MATGTGKLFAGRFELESRIGRGGMGEVYRAKDLQANRLVALKVLKPELAQSGQLAERFARELAATWMAQHPNTVKVFATGTGEGDRLYLAMELLEGRGLGAALAEVGSMEPARAARIGAQIADALGHAHASGVAHRDLKPDNVMLLDRGGDPDFVKVLDFGLVSFFGEAREGNPTLTATGIIIGTAAYMSPEQVLGRAIDHRTDVYSLGIVLFELLTGRVPFAQKNPLSVLRAQERDPPPTPSSLKAGLPPALEALVLRMLEKEPGKRPQTAAEVAAALRG